MFEIASTWVSAYVRNNPEAKIRVSSVPANTITSMIGESGNIGLITKQDIPDTYNKFIWKMPVGRDIIIPLMNSENPFLEEIYSSGISPKEFATVFAKDEKPTWGTLLNNNQANPVNIYCFSNELNSSYLADFLQTDIGVINEKEVSGIDEMLNEIQNDKYSFGFCRLVDVIDEDNQLLMKGLSLIPIDVNGNNKVDYFEDIYNNSSELERGVWVGKYPKELFSNIYTVAGYEPVRIDELAFLEWVITEGQQYLFANGYSELILSERHNNVQRLYASQPTIIDVQKPINSTTSFFVIGLIIIGAFISYIIMKLILPVNQDVEEESVQASKVLVDSSLIVPNGVFFDKSHTWAFMEMDGNVRIGIADFLQHVTGQITNVIMKNPGEFVKKGEPFLTLIQQGKQLNIQAPVSGEIKETNLQLNTNSSVINTSPYSQGWVYIIESNNWMKEIKTFFIGETYKVWINGEFLRLKHFFSSFIQLNVTNQLQQVIQDGGELNDGLLESFGPVIWEEFQSRFINREK
jgi:glycine cleavage system H lipoate-binding protein/ABC-type phosphate transport system substrate-binding protein